MDKISVKPLGRAEIKAGKVLKARSKGIRIETSSFLFRVKERTKRCKLFYRNPNLVDESEKFQFFE